MKEISVSNSCIGSWHSFRGDFAPVLRKYFPRCLFRPSPVMPIGKSRRFSPEKELKSFFRGSDLSGAEKAGATDIYRSESRN